MPSVTVKHCLLCMEAECLPRVVFEHLSLDSTEAMLSQQSCLVQLQIESPEAEVCKRSGHQLRACQCVSLFTEEPCEH